jgi:hypothetical protein
MCVTVIKHTPGVTLAVIEKIDGEESEDQLGNYRAQEPIKVIERVSNFARTRRIQSLDTGHVPDLPVVHVQKELSWAAGEALNSVFVVDTPGGNEAVLVNSPRVFLENAEACVYIIDYTKMGTRDEEALVSSLKSWLMQHAETTILLFNKYDQRQQNDHSKEVVLDSFLNQLGLGDKVTMTLRKNAVFCSARQYALGCAFKAIATVDPKDYTREQEAICQDFVLMAAPGEANEWMEYVQSLSVARRTKISNALMVKSSFFDFLVLIEKLIGGSFKV